MKKKLRQKPNKAKSKKEYLDAIIPSKIFKNNYLSDGAKVFYGVIVSLSYNEGYAFAATSYYASVVGRKRRSIQYYISELSEAGVIKVQYKGRFRMLIPVILPVDNNDRFVIPGEVLASDDTSSAVKLSYGLIQYKSVNKKGFFGFNDISDVAKMIGKSESTAYRHIRAYKKLDIVKIEKEKGNIRIYTFSQYQTNVKNSVPNQIRPEELTAPPDDVNIVPRKTSISPEVEAELRRIMGR